GARIDGPATITPERRSGGYGTGDAGRVDRAVAVRHLVQVLLVVVLGVVEGAGAPLAVRTVVDRADLGGDVTEPGALQLRCVDVARGPGGVGLLGRGGEDRRAVLRPPVVALAVPLGR